jgi:hypothetical protein
MTALSAEDRSLMHGGLVLGSTAAMGATPSMARAVAVTEAEKGQVVTQGVDSHVVRSRLLRSQLVELALGMPAALSTWNASATNHAMVMVIVR